MLRLILKSLLTFIVGLSSINIYAASNYRITDLGDLPGGQDLSSAVSINELGQVAGNATSLTGTTAFIWSSSTGMVNLGNFAGVSYSRAYGINNLGQVVGQGGNGVPGAFVYTPGTGMQMLGGLPAFTAGSVATAINDSGQVVGTGYSLTHPPTAFQWKNGTDAQLLANGFGESWGEAAAINTLGKIGGVAFNGNGYGGGALWDSAISAPISLGSNSTIHALNDFGIGVGKLSTNSYSQGQALFTAVRFNQCGYSCFPVDTITVLGDLPGEYLLHGNAVGSEALGINSKGEIVGTSDVNNAMHAFLWLDGEGMLDLNELIDPADPLKGNSILYRAQDINDQGWIVGQGQIGGVMHAFLLTPVPEPSGYAMFLGGLSVISVLARRRKLYQSPRF